MRYLLIILLIIPLSANARKEGIALIDSLTQRLPQITADTSKVETMATISYCYWNFNPDKGIQYGLDALALATKINFKRGIAGSNVALAMNYRYKGEYLKALDHCDGAMAVWQELGKKNKIAQIYFTKSMINIDQSEYPAALDNGLRSLKLSEEIKDSANIGRSLINIGIISDDLGDYDKALVYHTKALKLYEQLKDKSGIISSLSNIGLVYKEQKAYDKSVQVLLSALKMTEGTAYQNKQATVLGYLGDVYKEKKEYTLALKYLLAAKKIDEEVGNKAGLALRYQTIGLTYLLAATDSSKNNDEITKQSKKQNLDNAVEALSQSALMHKEIGNIKDLSENYRDLSTAEQLSGNYREALDHHLKFTVYNDSFNSTIKSKQLHELETKYETKEKDVQIADQKKQIAYNRKINLSLALSSALFLALGLFVYTNQRKTNRLNKLITSQKTELEKLNTVKDRIFSVISHDLRTPVNSLISFTQLLEHGNIPPEKMQKYADTLKNNLGYTAGLMENLLNWARTQMHGYKPVFEKFDVAETAAQTAGLLAPEAGKKDIQIIKNIPADTIVFADMNMTSLLIRNLLSNAIKYTPTGGTVTLTAHHTGHSVQINVQDTGVGISAGAVNEFNNSTADQQIDSTPGTNKEKGTGLGLMLCKGFAALMHGRITLKSTPGAGSCFTVELPA